MCGSGYKKSIIGETGGDIQYKVSMVTVVVFLVRTSGDEVPLVTKRNVATDGGR
jgi:hypothetical protein